VLKLLQESYLGKVKMIYIDPPYNTGNDFIYNDDFKMECEEWSVESGALDEDGNRMFKNTDSNGRFHSDWCSMIYSRLMLARNLLSDDGVIFISIDDNEQENLKKICDEVFGASNFIAQIAWKRKKEISNDSNNVAIQGEYILCYGKVNAKLALEPLSGEYVEKSYNEPTEEFPNGKWRPVPLTVSKGLSGGGYTYTITTPTGKEHTRLWAYPEQSYKKLLSENKVYFGKDKNGIPQRVMYLFESKGQPISNYWDNIATNKEGKKDILSIFGDNAFDTPKPTNLIKKMMRVTADKDDIILDFFSGSATTAHAVMQLNAEDGGHRKFIMVQLPEKTDEKSEAYKAGYKNICEIGKERIRRAGARIKKEEQIDNGFRRLGMDSAHYVDDILQAGKESAENLDTGFRVFKLDDSNMNDVYYSPNEYNQQTLDMFESNVKSDRTDLDLLFGCLLDWGLPLSLPYRSEEIDGCTVHNYNDGDLIACFDENIPDSVIKEIAKKQPLRAVFRDSSFADSPSKINVGEIFKLLAPDTRVKVI
jgi:adenine-specific DNA-methyltransferase